MTSSDGRAVLDVDEGQFVLVDPSGADLACPGGVELSLVSFAADNAMFVVVRTGAQWGPVEVTAATVERAPILGDEWEEAAEFSVRCSSGLALSELMGKRSLALCASGGDYRVRVCASGRSEGADLDYDELDPIDPTRPVERFLIHAWPSPLKTPIALRTAGTVDPDDDDAVTSRRQQCEAAGARIGRDLDLARGARRLSGESGAVRIEVVLPRAIDRVWKLIANLDITRVSAPNDAAVGNEFRMSTYDTSVDGFLGTDGQIQCRWTELAEPNRVAMTWVWMRTVQPNAHLEPRLQREPMFSVVLADQTAHTDEPEVLLTLTHADIPVEWVEDMTTIWESKIDQWAYQSRPKAKRR
jgi:uncharacterized protein YndB with AHSA1/START domain